jgi:hypothetical protein
MEPVAVSAERLWQALSKFNYTTLSASGDEVND